MFKGRRYDLFSFLCYTFRSIGRYKKFYSSSSLLCWILYYLLRVTILQPRLAILLQQTVPSSFFRRSLCFTDYIIEQVPSLLTRFWSLFFVIWRVTSNNTQHHSLMYTAAATFVSKSVRLWNMAIYVKITRDGRKFKNHAFKIVWQDDLTAQARIRLQSRSHVQHILLLFLGLWQLIIILFLDINLACWTS